MKIARSLLLAALGIGVTAIAVAFFVYRPVSQTSPSGQQEAQKAPVPTLNCAFYDFTRASIVVGFDFAADILKDGLPRFEERARASRDGNQTIFDAGDRPVWAYVPDDDGHPSITSPDGATRIILYGLKLDTAGAFFVEAGLRSNEYRNLNGQCQQANFGSARAVASEASDDARQ